MTIKGEALSYIAMKGSGQLCFDELQSTMRYRSETQLGEQTIVSDPKGESVFSVKASYICSQEKPELTTYPDGVDYVEHSYLRFK